MRRSTGRSFKPRQLDEREKLAQVGRLCSRPGLVRCTPVPFDDSESRCGRLLGRAAHTVHECVPTSKVDPPPHTHTHSEREKGGRETGVQEFGVHAWPSIHRHRKRPPQGAGGPEQIPVNAWQILLIWGARRVLGPVGLQKGTPMEWDTVPGLSRCRAGHPARWPAGQCSY
jgi:hypothetical protein